MNILLIQAYIGEVHKPIYPIGLSYLSTALPAHNVTIFDQNMCDGNPFSETENILLDFFPDVVGISIRNARCYLKSAGRVIFCHEQLGPTIRIIKKVAPKAVIVCGGPGFSMFPLRIMQDEPEIDFGVFLEGEESFPQLLENFESPDKVNGVFWRNRGEILFTGRYKPPRYESLPEPRRDLIDPRKYKEEYAVGIQTKRGCSLKCIYCSYPFLSGKTIRLRPPEEVVDEIENLLHDYGMREFTFVDNVFNVPLTHAKKVCEDIINRDLQVQWSAWFNERFMDEDFMDLAIRAGCRGFEFSPDGYSNSSLRWLNKNIQKEHIMNTYRLVRKRPQIKVGYNFLIAIPGQSVFSLASQALFWLKLKVFLRGRLMGIGFGRVRIEPNTELEKIALKEGVIDPKTDLYHPTFYSVGIVDWFRRSKIIKSTLRWIFKPAMQKHAALNKNR